MLTFRFYRATVVIMDSLILAACDVLNWIEEHPKASIMGLVAVIVTLGLVL